MPGRSLLVTLLAPLVLAGCSPQPADHGPLPRSAAIPARAARAAILGPADGEHRILRGVKPITLLIDPASVGSEHLFLGTERIAAGDSIPLHRHTEEEEALFVHRGHLIVRVGNEHGDAGPGGVVFIPRDTWVGVRNPGPDSAEFVYVFNEPSFAICLRAFSAPMGVTYHEPPQDSVARVRRACHQVVH